MSAREQDRDLDRKAALLDRAYYRLLRLANNLTLAACLGLLAAMTAAAWRHR